LKKLLLVLVLFGAAVTGAVYWFNRPRTLAVHPDLFTYEAVARGTMTDTVSATGLVQPRQLVLVGSDAAGTVVDLPADVNDTVEEGQVLLRLDDRRARLRLQEAEAGLASARAGLSKAEALKDAADRALKFQVDIDKAVASRSERDQREAAVRAAQAGVELARGKLHEVEAQHQQALLALEETQVKVPLTEASRLSPGAPKHRYLVVERKVQLGQAVAPPFAAHLFTLAGDLQHLEVHAQVAEGDIGKVRKGQAVAFTVSAYAEEAAPFRGTVTQIRPMPVNEKGAVYYTTVIAVENQRDPESGEWRLRPGMTASVDIVRQEHKDVWKVPSAALNFQLEGPYQSDAAKARLEEWKQRPDQADWRPVWVWDEQAERPWPVFVRVGELKDGQFHEVREWEPGRQPPRRVITGAPPATRPGIFDQPNLKVA
jgi:HlyD family secretion protein